MIFSYFKSSEKRNFKKSLVRYSGNWQESYSRVSHSFFFTTTSRDVRTSMCDILAMHVGHSTQDRPNDPAGLLLWVRISGIQVRPRTNLKHQVQAAIKVECFITLYDVWMIQLFQDGYCWRATRQVYWVRERVRLFWRSGCSTNGFMHDEEASYLRSWALS